VTESVVEIVVTLGASSGKVGAKIAVKVSAKLTKEAAEKLAKEMAEKALKEAAEAAEQQLAKSAGKQTSRIIEETGEMAAKRMAKGGAEKAAKEGAEQCGKKTGKEATEYARKVGKQGEDAAGINARKKGFQVPGTNRWRFPDAVTEFVLKEVKNVAKLSFTRQLRDYVKLSKHLGVPFELWVREGAHLSKPLREAIDNGDIILRWFTTKP